MSEYLLEQEQRNNNEEEKTIKERSSHDEDFEIDILEDTLKHIYSKSKLRKKLAYILGLFYKSPALIILFSFLFGFIFFGLPLILIYIKVFDNFFIPICIMLILSFILNLTAVLIRIIDDKKNNIKIIDKWERKNLINYFGIILTLIILLTEGFLLLEFFGKIIIYNEEGKLKLIYEPEKEEGIDENDLITINDFFLKYIVNCFLLKKEKIDNDKSKVKNFINKKVIIKLLRELCISYIPFLIFSFNKLIQTIIIKVHYSIPKFIMFSSSVCFCLLIIIMKYVYKNQKGNLILSFFEMVFIILFFFGYLMWSIGSIWKKYKNPKDKSFAIYKYELQQLIFIYIFDFINIIGASFIFISFLVSYINFNYKDETFYDLKLVLLLLKLGFFLIILSYSFYYGHSFLSLIFRPIALQYAPVKLKENYIRANKNLSSYLFIF